jgi:hypothetical protein
MSGLHIFVGLPRVGQESLVPAERLEADRRWSYSIRLAVAAVHVIHFESAHFSEGGAFSGTERKAAISN